MKRPQNALRGRSRPPWVAIWSVFPHLWTCVTVVDPIRPHEPLSVDPDAHVAITRRSRAEFALHACARFGEIKIPLRVPSVTMRDYQPPFDPFGRLYVESGGHCSSTRHTPTQLPTTVFGLRERRAPKCHGRKLSPKSMILSPCDVLGRCEVATADLPRMQL